MTSWLVIPLALTRAADQFFAVRGIISVRSLGLIVLGLAAVRPAIAARVDDLIRIHLEAIGGRDRVDELKAMRANGRVIVGAKQMRFTMIAARPDRIRVETEQDSRTLVQGSDGRNAPWEFDTGEWPPKYHDMAPTVAKTFAADAEFDDPLVAGPARGFTFDYAGEVSTEGKKLLRILVTRQLKQSFSLLLDPDTFLILRRIEERKSPLGGTAIVVTQFGDYRPVDGVLVPHQIALAIDGKVKQRTQIDSVQANPEIKDDAFSRPIGIVTPAKR